MLASIMVATMPNRWLLQSLRIRPLPCRRSSAAVVIGLLFLASPASAQMLGPIITQMAGPFAGRMGANRLEMAPLYGSQAGALPHLLQGTQTLAVAGNGQIGALDGIRIAV